MRTSPRRQSTTVPETPEAVPAPAASPESADSVVLTAKAPNDSAAPKTEKAPTTRMTVDLPRDQHRALRRLADELADELERPRVTGQDVMAGLARLALKSDDVRDRLATELRNP